MQVLPNEESCWVVVYTNVCDKGCEITHWNISKLFQTLPGHNCSSSCQLFSLSPPISTVYQRDGQRPYSRPDWRTIDPHTHLPDNLEFLWQSGNLQYCYGYHYTLMIVFIISHQLQILITITPIPDFVMAIITCLIEITIAMALSVGLLSSSPSFPLVYWRDCEDNNEAIPKLLSTYQIEHPSLCNVFISQLQPLKSIGWCPSHLSLISIFVYISCRPGYKVFLD